jgi:hypothetical protein
VESGASALAGAFGPDITAVGQSDLTCHVASKSKSSMATHRTGVGLHDAVEDAVEVVPPRYRSPHRALKARRRMAVVRVPSDPYLNLAIAPVLHRVLEEVHQDLAYATAVDQHQRWRIRSDHADRYQLPG